MYVELYIGDSLFGTKIKESLLQKINEQVKRMQQALDRNNALHEPSYKYDQQEGAVKSLTVVRDLEAQIKIWKQFQNELSDTSKEIDKKIADMQQRIRQA